MISEMIATVSQKKKNDCNRLAHVECTRVIQSRVIKETYTLQRWHVLQRYPADKSQLFNFLQPEPEAESPGLVTTVSISSKGPEIKNPFNLQNMDDVLFESKNQSA
jgi:hypothetical protein